MVYALPEFVQHQLLQTLNPLPQQDIKQAGQELSQRYRRQQAGQHLQHPHAIDAYLSLRLPATYAVMCQVWQRLQEIAPTWQPQSLVDLGAGPGTATLAATAFFESWQQLYLLEAHPGMLQAGRQLFAQGTPVLKQAHWQAGHLPTADWPETEVACLSYVLNELPDSDWSGLFFRLAQRHRLLLFVEPGTPVGFEHLRRVRQHFLAQHWFVWAPCPHQQTCPILAPDWCHFSQRLARSARHRQLKAGTKGHEDEKFAYLILGQLAPPTSSTGRILRHPEHHKGHLRLKLCTSDGLLSEAVRSKKDANWKQSRQLSWGDRV